MVFLYQGPEDQLWFVTSIDGINDGSGGSVAADLSDLGGADIEVADDNSNESIGTARRSGSTSSGRAAAPTARLWDRWTTTSASKSTS